MRDYALVGLPFPCLRVRDFLVPGLPLPGLPLPGLPFHGLLPSGLAVEGTIFLVRFSTGGSLSWVTVPQYCVPFGAGGISFSSPTWTTNPIPITKCLRHTSFIIVFPGQYSYSEHGNCNTGSDVNSFAEMRATYGKMWQSVHCKPEQHEAIKFSHVSILADGT